MHVFLEVSPEYIVLEKTGHITEITELLEQLEPYGVLAICTIGKSCTYKTGKRIECIS